MPPVPPFAAGGRLTSANLRMSMNKRRATIKAMQDRRKSVELHRRQSRMASMSGAGVSGVIYAVLTARAGARMRANTHTLIDLS